MNAETELLNAYREWHRLALAEAKAIRTHNWDLLADCQLAIADFQILAGRLMLDARSEWERAGLDVSEKQRHLQVFVHDLIEITRQNQSMLQRAKDEAAAKLDDLAEAGRNIGMLRRSYGSAGITSFAT
jgi:hypothetical protein